MPRSPLPDELKAFLAEPNPSVIATLSADGKPHSAATWYLWDGGRVLVNMAATRRRLANMRREVDSWYGWYGGAPCTGS